MTDLKTLRPYFDRLVEEALDGAQERTRTTAPRLQASKEDSTQVIAVDVPRAHRRAGRRWLAVAAAAMVFVAAAAVLMTRAEDKEVRTKTPATTPRPAPGPVERSVTSPDSVFPVEGALPSTPETGELVAGVAFTRFINFPDEDRWRDTSIVMYADGRLLRYPTPDAHGGIAEQRLTAEGVALVRSAFAPTGLLDPALTPIDVSSCRCVIRVRDDSGRVVDAQPQAQPPPVDPQVQSELDRLVEFITHLDTSLPASAWADREIKAYVPSRYEVSVWFEPSEAPENLDDGLHNVAVPDLSNVLEQVLPRAAVQDLDDHGWQHTPWGDSVVLSTADARALAQAFTDAGTTAIVPPFYTWGMGLTYHPAVRAPDPTTMNIRVEALLPDGRPLWAPG